MLSPAAVVGLTAGRTGGLAPDLLLLAPLHRGRRRSHHVYRQLQARVVRPSSVSKSLKVLVFRPTAKQRHSLVSLSGAVCLEIQ